MNYIGSKLTLSPFLIASVQERVGRLETKVFCDLFAGCASVGRAFKPLVKSVIANDVEYYAYVLNKNYIENNAPMCHEELFFALETLPPVEGFIFNHYSLEGAGRAYFSAQNAQKIDAMRLQIEQWKQEKTISDAEYFFLLASLLESADSVANTASIYTAFLKTMKAAAQKPMRLKPARYEIAGEQHRVYREDANALIETIKGDILYIDPPYNIRQYGATYHLLNTIARYDVFEPQGKTGMREYFRSRYCGHKKALAALEELIAKARFDTIFLSYNNEGLMHEEEIAEIMSRYGKYTCKKTAHHRLRTHNLLEKRASTTVEYLHILEK
jgi:adenine-specific DNA-methyltransferase